MSAPAKPSAPWRAPALFAAILIVGFALRLWGLDRRSVWLDEGHSLAFVRAPAGAMARAIAFDDHPPLYYWLLRPWMALGRGPAWGRLFSVLCSAATLPVAYALARSLAGPGAALGAMALLAVSPQAVYYAQELRMYALESLLAAAMMAFGIAAIRRPSRLPLAGAAVFGVLACYTHYFSAAFVLGFLMVLPWVRRQGESNAGPAAVRAAVLALGAALLYWPWLDTAMAHVLVNSFRGLKAAAASTSPDAAFLDCALQTCLGFIPALPFDAVLFPSPGALIQVRQWTALGFTALLLAFFLLGLLELRSEPQARRFFIAFLVLPGLLTVVFQACGGRFYPRFLVPMLPLGFACAARGIGRLPTRGARWAAGAVMGAVMLSSTAAMLRTDIREVSRDVAGQLERFRAEFQGRPAAAAPVLHAREHSFWTLMAYDPTPRRHRFLAGPDVPALARLLYGPGVQIKPAELAELSDVWVAYSDWNSDPSKLRERRWKIERLWFGEGWRLETSVSATRYNKRMDLVLYSRLPGGKKP